MSFASRRRGRRPRTKTSTTDQRATLAVAEGGPVRLEAAREKQEARRHHARGLRRHRRGAIRSRTWIESGPRDSVAAGVCKIIFAARRSRVGRIKQLCRST
eukprot:4346148-Pyramimonas_sp.AAC.1